MLAKTHIIGGVAAGLAAAVYTDLEPATVIVFATVGSIIPDIDHIGSTSGRALRPLSRLISGIFGHRTFTHSIAFLGVAAWLLSMVSTDVSLILGVLVGMASHIVLDAMTEAGVKLFYPLKISFRIPLYINTGGAMEKVVFVGLVFLSLYLMIDLVQEVRT